MKERGENLSDTTRKQVSLRSGMDGGVCRDIPVLNSEQKVLLRATELLLIKVISHLIWTLCC